MPAKATSFLIPASTGSVSVSCGFKPNLIIFIGGKEADPQVGDNTSLSEPGITFHGVAALLTNGTIGNQCSSIYAKIGVYATTDCFGKLDSSHSIIGLGTGHSTLFEGAVTQFTDTGFDVNFTVVDGTQRRVKCIAYQMSEIYVAMGSFTSPSSIPNNQSITGLGFTPQGVMFLGGGSQPGNTDSYSQTFGWDDGTSKVSYAHTAKDLATGNVTFTTQTSSRVPSDSHSILDRFNSNDAVSAYKGKILSFDSDGFTIQWDAANTLNPKTFLYCAIFNLDFKVGRFNPGTQNLSVGFQPDGTIFQTAGLTQMEDELGQSASLGYSIGAIDSLTSFVENSVHISMPPNPVSGGTGRTRTAESASSGQVISDSFTTYGTMQVTVNSFSDTGMNITAAGAASADFMYLAMRENPIYAGNPLIILDDMDLAPGQTHYFTIGHKNAGVARASWTVKLFKNGDQIQTQAVDMRENPSGIYTFQFVNDGTHDSQWSLVVYETASPTTKYTQSWKVYKKLVEQNVKLIRTRMDSEGGFVASSQGNDK